MIILQHTICKRLQSSMTGECSLGQKTCLSNRNGVDTKMLPINLNTASKLNQNPHCYEHYRAYLLCLKQYIVHECDNLLFHLFTQFIGEIVCDQCSTSAHKLMFDFLMHLSTQAPQHLTCCPDSCRSFLCSPASMFIYCFWSSSVKSIELERSSFE